MHARVVFNLRVNKGEMYAMTDGLDIQGRKLIKLLSLSKKKSP